MPRDCVYEGRDVYGQAPGRARDASAPTAPEEAIARRLPHRAAATSTHACLLVLLGKPLGRFFIRHTHLFHRGNGTRDFPLERSRICRSAKRSASRSGAPPQARTRPARRPPRARQRPRHRAYLLERAEGPESPLATDTCNRPSADIAGGYLHIVPLQRFYLVQTCCTCDLATGTDGLRRRPRSPPSTRLGEPSRRCRRPLVTPERHPGPIRTPRDKEELRGPAAPPAVDRDGFDRRCHGGGRRGSLSGQALVILGSRTAFGDGYGPCPVTAQNTAPWNSLGWCDSGGAGGPRGYARCRGSPRTLPVVITAVRSPRHEKRGHPSPERAAASLH